MTEMTPPPPPANSTAVPGDRSHQDPPAWRRRRTAITGGIAAASLGLVALTAGVTAVTVDALEDDDDRISTVQTGGALTSEASPGSSDGSQANNASETATVEQFESARDAAVDAAGGGTLVELERTRDGWSAEVLRQDGSEVDVRLGADLGDAVVGIPERSNDVRVGSLDGDGIARAIEAALSEVGGRAHEIALTDDDGGAYQVDIRGEVRADIVLDAQYAVIEVDLD